MRAALALCLLAALPASAEDAAGCYALPKGERSGEVASLTIDGFGRVALVLPGVPHVSFEMTCELGADGTAFCGVDCDGGNLELKLGPDGLRARFSHLRFEAARMESLVFGQAQFDADGLAFTGTFTLPPADASACDTAGKTQPFDLRPGDFTPVVARLERSLAAGGYLTEAPDWYYTAATAAAVSAFQAEAGLPVTGRATPEVMARLAVFSGYGYGGC